MSTSPNIEMRKRRCRRPLPADAERQFAERIGAATIEVASGHLAMVTHADEVASLIGTAAKAVTADDLAAV